MQSKKSDKLPNQIYLDLLIERNKNINVGSNRFGMQNYGCDKLKYIYMVMIKSGLLMKQIFSFPKQVMKAVKKYFNFNK